jgi:cytochrome P450
MSIGQTVTIEALERDPYPIYERLRDEEPVSWVPAVGLWLVTRFDDVRGVDLDPETFTAATQPSTLNRTMGVNMLGWRAPTSSVSAGSWRRRSDLGTSRGAPRG